MLKIELTERESSYLLKDLRNFSEIFRKGVSYDRLSPLLWKMYFWKSHRRDGQTDSPDILRLIDMDMLLMIEKGIREGFIGKDIY